MTNSERQFPDAKPRRDYVSSAAELYNKVFSIKKSLKTNEPTDTNSLSNQRKGHVRRTVGTKLAGMSSGLALVAYAGGFSLRPCEAGY